MTVALQGIHYIDRLPSDARHLHTERMVLRWSDMDAFGHVNNAMYFTYFEQVRVDWLRTLGVGHGLVLANASCTYLKPLTFPAEIDVALYAGHAGKSSLHTYFTIQPTTNLHDVYSLGHGTIVWFDHAAGRSVTIPEAVRRQLNKGR